MFLELMSRLPRAAAQVFLEMSRQGLATNQAYLMVAGQPEADQAWKEAQRCLNCDVQTVFNAKLCIECDACVDICPMDCITFTTNGDEADLRTRLKAPALNLAQDLYVSGELKTGRVMVKDEDVCLHCGLCAERCPTGAWDMQKFLLTTTQAGPACRDPRPATETLEAA